MSSRHHDDIESRVAAALERQAERLPVAAAPVAEIRRDASRPGRRVRSEVVRRPWVAALAVAAASALLVGGAGIAAESLLPAASDRATDAGPAEGGQPPLQTERRLGAPPMGSVWLGVGPVVVSVPSEWVLDAGDGRACPRDAAYVTSGADPQDDADACDLLASRLERVTVGPVDDDTPGMEQDRVVSGEPAGRAGVFCFQTRPPQCGASVVFDELGLEVGARSTTDARTVDDILDRVRVVDDHAGVPAYEGLGVETYVRLLESYGLVAMPVPVAPSEGETGTVVSTDVEPGTVVPRGAAVEVTYVADSEDPVDFTSPTAATDEDLVGTWRLVDVAGQPPLPGTLGRIVLTGRTVTWNDGVNRHVRQYDVGPDGALSTSAGSEERTGCTPRRRCERPAGVGVEQADRVLVGPQSLILMDGGRELARYEPVP
ncbi:PASTA domain-containing protein [Nocardioidaceae bacterium]|nr:PASTA domain-containing protein [Nocardioidaceae bacterium]